MDTLTKAIVDFARDFRSERVSAASADTVTDHILDALGCAIAARDEVPARAARDLAADAKVEGGASVIGLATLTTVERAAMANSIAMRCLDYNDTYNGLKTGGHPSDMVAGVLAAAEAAKLPGRALIDGVWMAYQIFGTLADQVPLREHATDQGPLLALGAVTGIATIRKFTAAQTANAISLAVTSTMPSRSSRSGELSMWKGAATGHSVGNAVQVVALAERGMEGPPEPFSGVDGFFKRVPADIDVSKFTMPVEGKSVIERTGFKFSPVEWGAQASTELFLTLSKRIKVDDIESIDISGYEFLYREIGGGRNDAKEKWDPQTRETADHSLPYLVARALVDGEMTLKSFEPDKVLDPKIRPLMKKITVRVAPDIKDYPVPRQPVWVTIKLKGGQTIEEFCEYALGHDQRPGTRADIEEKFRSLALPMIGKTGTAKLQAEIRGLPQMKDVSQLTASLRACFGGA